MTREEEIKQAAYSQYCNSESICFTLICDSFKQGAKWADKHPDVPSLWHDASEIPDKQGNLLYILPQGSLHISNIPSALRACKLNKVSWEEYTKELGIVQWAYVSDLLPKTKEL